MLQFPSIKFEPDGADRDIMLPVAPETEIVSGQAVGLVGGMVRPLVAGDRFFGFAKDSATHSPHSGPRNIPIKHYGAVKASISGLESKDIGKPVYASDAVTFTLAASGNSRVGYVLLVNPGGGKGTIRFDGGL